MMQVTSGLRPVARNFIMGRMASYLADAEEGLLELGATRQEGVVGAMAVTEDRVLELRFETEVATDGTKQATRLYFTEPDVDPDLLLALHIQWKRPTREGSRDQDAHALEASDRIDRHYQ